MSKIGEIDGYPVICEDNMRDLDVIESMTTEQIIETIRNSKAYYEATHCGLINGNVKIVTWEDRSSYKGITYHIQLVRNYYVGCFGRTRDDKKIVQIYESDSRFKVIFTGKSKGLEEFFNIEIAEHVSSSHMDDYITTYGKTRAEAEQNVARDIDKILKYLMPKYLKSIDKEIAALEAKKEKCERLFGLSN